MAKPDKDIERSTTTDPCAATYELIGSGGILTLRVEFSPAFRLSTLIGRVEVDVTNESLRYEFTETGVTLLLEFQAPADQPAEVRQRTGNSREWGPLAPITVPTNDRCVPVEFLIWKAGESEPSPNSPPPLKLKPRRHAPKTGTTRQPKKDE